MRKHEMKGFHLFKEEKGCSWYIIEKYFIFYTRTEILQKLVKHRSTKQKIKYTVHTNNLFFIVRQLF